MEWIIRRRIPRGRDDHQRFCEVEEEEADLDG